MPESVTISCEDCAQPVETKRRNTKYCAVCRLIRDLPFVTGTPKVCALCENHFAPLGVHDHCCGDCAPDYQKFGKTECAFCHQTAIRVRAEVAVCGRCARNPELRKKLWASLKRKQEHRRTDAA